MMAKSLRAWTEFRARVAELGGEVLEPEYLGSGKPHRCQCATGHECAPRPNSVQRGQGICWTCAGTSPAAAWENFRRQVTELGGVVLEPGWLGKDTCHRCLCAAGHECSPRPGDVNQGRRNICPVCTGRDQVILRTKFQEQVESLGGILLEPAWLGTETPHRCRCAKGHECMTRPHALQNGQGMCKFCAGRDPATTWARFRQQVGALGGTVLEPEYLGSGKPHRCQCAAGHKCAPRPDDINQGRGICRICAGNDPDTAQEKFFARIIKLGAELLDPEWLGNKVPRHCRCAKGHECWPTPANVINGGDVCLKCRWGSQDTLYVTRNPATCCIKFGITSPAGYRPRLVTHRKNGFTEVIRLETGLPGGLAAHVEQKIKAALKMAGAKPVRGREYFDDENTALILNEIGIWIP